MTLSSAFLQPFSECLIALLCQPKISFKRIRYSTVENLPNPRKSARWRLWQASPILADFDRFLYGKVIQKSDFFTIFLSAHFNCPLSFFKNVQFNLYSPYFWGLYVWASVRFMKEDDARDVTLFPMLHWTCQLNFVSAFFLFALFGIFFSSGSNTHLL